MSTKGKLTGNPQACFTALAAAVVLTGCAARSENPADGGFIAGLSALSSGTYDRRLEERQARLQNEEVRNARMKAQAASAESERSATSAELASVKERYDGLNREIEELDRRLVELQSSEKGDTRRLVALRSDLDRLSQQTTLAGADPMMSAAEKEGTLLELRERKEKLLAALEEAALK